MANKGKHEGGVQVQISLAASTHPKAWSARSSADLQQSASPAGSEHSNSTATDQPPSSTSLWLLFIFGWVFPPSWWIGVAVGGGFCSSTGAGWRGLAPGARAAWWWCLAMSIISGAAAAVILVLVVTFGPPSAPGPSKEYFFTVTSTHTINSSITDNSTSTLQLPLLSSSPEALSKVAEAIHHTLRLPAAYPSCNVQVWLVDPETSAGGRPAPSRQLLFLHPFSNPQQHQKQHAAAGRAKQRLLLQLQDQQLQRSSVLQAPSQVTWGFQLLPGSWQPDAFTLDTAIAAPDTAGTLLLQLVVAGAVDAAALGQLVVGFTDEQGSSKGLQDSQPTDPYAGAVDATREVLQYPPRPLPPGACTCRLGWDSSRQAMDCPSPWTSLAGTSKVPPALQIINGSLVEQVSGRPALLHGLNFFGWNVDTLNFDGLWAYNDDEIPTDASISWEHRQQLNISWWGKRRMTNDFAAVVHRIKLLGFNALRVQFKFDVLQRDLPSSGDPEFYPCLHDSDEYIGVAKTLDPQLAVSLETLDGLQQLLPPYTGMPHPPIDTSGSAQCSSLPWSVPFSPNYTGTGQGPNLNLTMCNWYLPQGPGVTAVHRFLWQLQYLVSQGFYLLLDFQSARKEEPNMQHPQLLAENWRNLWKMLTDLPEYREHLAGRIFPDLVNEPSRWNCLWEESCSRDASRVCAPALQSYGMAAAAIWQVDASVPVLVNGLGQTHDYNSQSCGSGYPSMSWGDGFITAAETLRDYDLNSNPSAFFAAAARMHGASAGLVLAPHLYPMSITWNQETPEATLRRWGSSWGLKKQGLDTTPEGAPMPAMPVLVGEFGAYDFGDNTDSNTDTTVFTEADRAWFASTAAYLKSLARQTGRPLSWLSWVWNANSHDTKGVVGPQTTWREVQWTKVRMLMKHFELQPWYCAHFPNFCANIQY